MRVSCLGVFTVFALTASTTLVGGGDKGVEGDLKKIQGTWKFTAHEMDGKAMPADELKKLKITFTGDKFSVEHDGKVVQAGTHKLDGSKKPGQIDSKVTEGEGKGGMMLGIYEMKGDTVKVCFDPTGKERPTSLTAKAGQFSATIQREKK